MVQSGNTPSFLQFLNFTKINTPSIISQINNSLPGNTTHPTNSLGNNFTNFNPSIVLQALPPNGIKVTGYGFHQVGTYGNNITQVINPVVTVPDFGARSGGVIGSDEADNIEVNIQGKPNKPAMLNLDMKSGADIVSVLNSTEYAKIIGKMGKIGGDTDKDIFRAGGKEVEYQLTFGKDSSDQVSVEKGSQGLSGSFTLGGADSNGINNTVILNDSTNSKLNFYQAQAIKFEGNIQNLNKLEFNASKKEYTLTTLNKTSNPPTIDNIYTFDNFVNTFEMNGKTYNIPSDLDQLNTAIKNYVPKNIVQQEGGEVFLTSLSNNIVFDGDKTKDFNYSGLKMYGSNTDDKYEYNGKGLSEVIFFENKNTAGDDVTAGQDTLKFSNLNKKDLYRVEYNGLYDDYIQLMDSKTGTLFLIKKKDANSQDAAIDKFELKDGSLTYDDLLSIATNTSLDSTDPTPYAHQGGNIIDKEFTFNFSNATASIQKGTFSALEVRGGSNSNDVLELSGFTKDKLKSEFGFKKLGDNSFYYRDNTIPDSVITYANKIEYVKLEDKVYSLKEFEDLYNSL